MTQNKYDDPAFFEKYSQMSRSKNGLEGAGEWHVLQRVLPDFTNKTVVDMAGTLFMRLNTVQKKLSQAIFLAK